MTDLVFGRRRLIAGAAGFAVTAAMPRLARAEITVDQVAFDPDIPALGNPDGNITIVEFVDYQCPICKLCFKEVQKLLAEDDNVRLVMKDWPIFGDASRDAASLTLAAAGNYGAVVTALMENQRQLSSRRTDAIVEAAGIDAELLRGAADSKREIIGAVLARNDMQAADFQLRGTPALVVGGRLYQPQPPQPKIAHHPHHAAHIHNILGLVQHYHNIL